MFIFAKSHDDSNGHVWHHNIMASVNLVDIKNGPPIPIQVKDGLIHTQNTTFGYNIISISL